MAVIQTKKEDSKYDYLKKVYKNTDKVKMAKSSPKGEEVVVKQKESEKIQKKDWLKVLAIFVVLLALSVSGYLISKYLK